MIQKKNEELRGLQQVILLNDMDICPRLTKKVELGSQMRRDPR